MRPDTNADQSADYVPACEVFTEGVVRGFCRLCGQIPADHPHGEIRDQGADTARPYRRPQWTGRPMVFSDGSPDYEFAQCPSCLTFHHERSKSCNGKREPWPTQCAAALGEVQCQRPGNHLGPHEAESETMRMEWEPKAAHSDGDTDV